MRLEVQPDLSLKLSTLVVLGSRRGARANDKTKILVVDVQVGRGRLRMVEDVGSIHSDFHVPGFADSDRLGHTGIKAPDARTLDDALTERSVSTRQGILQQNLIR